MEEIDYLKELDKINILVENTHFNLQSIEVKKVENSYSPAEDIKELIDIGWEEKSEVMKKKGHNFFNGKLTRFENINFDVINYKTQVLISSDICYKDVVGLRYSNKFNDLVVDDKSNPNALSVINILISTDNKIILGIRNKMGDWEELLEVSGGFFRFDETGLKESCNNRLCEDFKIYEDNVLEQQILSIYNFESICETTVLFITFVDFSSDEISSLKHNYHQIFTINNNLDELENIFSSKEKFHLPSFIALSYYYKRLLENIKSSTASNLA